jgi:hypothetical protein
VAARGEAVGAGMCPYRISYKCETIPGLVRPYWVLTATLVDPTLF